MRCGERPYRSRAVDVDGLRRAVRASREEASAQDKMGSGLSGSGVLQGPRPAWARGALQLWRGARSAGLPAVAAFVCLAAPSGVRAAEAIGRVDAYLPFRLGDSWTYDWRQAFAGGSGETVSRTRSFESLEFVGPDLAYRLVDDDGNYNVFSLKDGVLRLHSSSEGGRVLYYEPPVVLVAPDMTIGTPRVTENPDTGRTWRASLLGFEDVEVPLGRFTHCLKLRLEMESAEHSSRSDYTFAERVGLVAFAYELRDRVGGRLEASIDSGLRLARLAGIPIASPADLARLAGADTIRLGGRDEPEARALLKQATEARYTWDVGFPGFAGTFSERRDGSAPVSGRFTVDASLAVHVEAGSEADRARVSSQLSSFLSHRKLHPFDEAYGTASFRLGAREADGTREVLADGDTMGTRYRIKDGEILSVGRSVGRVRFEARNLKQIWTGDGRYITVEYELVYFSNEDGRQLSSERIQDSYARFGGYWLPTGRRSVRTEAGREVGRLQLELEPQLAVSR